MFIFYILIVIIFNIVVKRHKQLVDVSNIPVEVFSYYYYYYYYYYYVISRVHLWWNCL